MRSLSVLLTACSLLALAGCGGGQDRRAEPRIDRAAASELANESQTIADRFDSGDACGAAHLADELYVNAVKARDQGRVPVALAGELIANAQTLRTELSCPVPPPPPVADEHGKKKHGEKKKHKEKND